MIIKPLSTTGPDERGYTAEYYHPRLGQHLVSFRKAGSVSGRHYHKGIVLAKNPETLILLSGKCIANWKEINGSRVHTAIVEGSVDIGDPAVCMA